MDATSRTEKEEFPDRAPAGLITKETNHPLGVVLLGEVVAAHWMNDGLVLYYADKHKARITIDEDELRVEDLEVPSC